MDSEYKEVDYATYCKTCKYQDVSEVKDPCFDCLDEPVRLYSSKPAEWKEK